MGVRDLKWLGVWEGVRGLRRGWGLEGVGSRKGAWSLRGRLGCQRGLGVSV